MGVKPRPRRRPNVVKFYFSYRSPYAWFATLRLPDVLGTLPVDVLYRPVWEPDPALSDLLTGRGMAWSFPPLSRQKRRYIFQDVRRHVQASGLEFTWPIDRDPDWSVPHIGLLYARHHGKEKVYHRRIFDLRFARGQNITDPRCIERVARELGMDAVDMVRALEDGRYEREIVRCFHEASEDDVFGWPFFVYGRQKFWGNDRLEWLAAAIRSDHASPFTGEEPSAFSGVSHGRRAHA
jgi:2-hydroxychromene-2-carboxylate isomerase